ncbi:MAG: sulfatase [Candidatus Promineifilaceae bacterium]
MKAIMIMFDTLNRHMLPPYGCEWTHAPNFSRLAEQSVTFDNCYAASVPCMPARRELHTGRYNFLHRSWGPLEPFDDSMPEILRENGIYSHLVSDHQHYWEDGGATYHTRYSSWEFARGQEGDPWKGHVADPDTPADLKQFKGGMVRQDWINRGYMTREEDHPQALTFANGLHFIHTNHEQDNWFLQIETFDPHEPFFTHQEYKDLYPHDYDGPHFDWPDYARVTQTEEQVQHVRYEYAALVSMCDRYLGRILDTMDELDMWDDTMLIVCTDHGFLLGEHDWWAKSIQPWYNELVHIPLFLWDPRSRERGQRRESLVQMIDFAPMLLEFFGIERPSDMQGAPLIDTLATDEPVREGGLFGIHGGHANVTDGRYVYMRAPINPDNKPLYEYTLMPTHMRARFGVAELQDIQLAEPFSFTKGTRTMKIETRSMFNPHGFGTMLFDLESDPGQENPIVDEDIERRMIRLLVALMQANDAPPEQYERLGLPDDGDVRDEHLLLKAQHEQALRAMQPARIMAPEAGDGHFNLNTPLKEIMADPDATAILNKHFPGFTENPMLKMAEGASLQQIAGFAASVFTDEKLTAVATDLQQLG